MGTLIRNAVKRAIGALGFELVRRGSVSADLQRLRSDFSAQDYDLIRAVESYTQTSPERLHALIRAVEYVVKNGIPGAIVECGVWKGGSMMAVAKTLLRAGVRDRELYLYDTFGGMSEPSREDVSHWGRNAAEGYRRYREKGEDPSGLFEMNTVPLEEVRKGIHSAGYDAERIHFIRGKVEDTIPGTVPETISLLRLDTDWYESTRHEMEHLFPRLSRGGVLILDDYGEWRGARRAVDEYIEANGISILLNRIDYTGRIGVKL